MFGTLESNWDTSARRGRATLASFAMQAFGLSLLVAISLLWVERPPLVHWVQISAPASFTPVATEVTQVHRSNTNTTTVNASHQLFTASLWVNRETARTSNAGTEAADAPNIDSVYGPNGPNIGVLHGFDNNMPVVIPPRPATVKPLIVSNLGTGSLVYRVQPTYPPLAKQARVQGAVELRAVISKEGTIENLMIVRGHPMLSAAAIEAVRQWRYRPYLLNGEPIEVETEITVNFLLSGG
jgi:TonB family protein